MILLWPLFYCSVLWFTHPNNHLVLLKCSQYNIANKYHEHWTTVIFYVNMYIIVLLQCKKQYYFPAVGKQTLLTINNL